MKANERRKVFDAVDLLTEDTVPLWQKLMAREQRSGAS